MCNNTIGTFTDHRDGRVYKTVIIGTQTWMAENLDYNAKDSKYYKDDPDKYKKYGRLYDWNTATANGFAPLGWHLPKKIEWEILLDAVGGSLTAGTVLKSKSGWNKNNGTDNSDFSALPGGYYSCGKKEFYKAHSNGLWWSADANDTTPSSAHYYHIDSSATIHSRSGTKYNLYSVRCVQD